DTRPTTRPRRRTTNRAASPSSKNGFRRRSSRRRSNATRGGAHRGSRACRAHGSSRKRRRDDRSVASSTATVDFTSRRLCSARATERYPAARAWLDEHGYRSTVEYLVAMCRLVLDETGLLPHANAGALFEDELASLRPVSASQGMMLETLADLPCHHGSPDKT